MADPESGGRDKQHFGRPLTRKELTLLKRMGFEPWGGGHWVSWRDNYETCYPEVWAVEEALEWAATDGITPCAECVEYWPALLGDFLCGQHRTKLDD